MRGRRYSLVEALLGEEEEKESGGGQLPKIKTGFLGNEISVNLSPRWALKLKGDWTEEVLGAAQGVLEEINEHPERFGVQGWLDLDRVFRQELVQELGLDTFQHGLTNLLLPKLQLQRQGEGVELELGFYNKTNWSPKGEGETWGVTVGGKF